MSAASTSDPLTLRRLVAEPGLGLSVVEPGDLDREVTGAHAIEIEHPHRWLRPRQVMLTTGLRFAAAGEHAAGAEELVVELSEAGVSGLLFGIGVHFSQVPQPLVRAARRHQMPLIAVALDTPFHVVEDFVMRWTMSAHTVALERTVRLQEDLLRTLASHDPVSALVSRLAELTRGSAALYDGTGATVAATGEAPHRLIWNEVTHLERGRPFTVGRWSACAADLDMPGAQLTLTVAARNAGVIDDLGATLTRIGAHVLSAANGIRSVALTHERAEASRIIAALQAGVPGPRVSQTWARLRPYKVAAGSGLRVLTASPRTETTALSPRRPSDELLELAHSLGLGLVMDIVETADDAGITIRALVANGPGTQEWTERLGRDHIAGLSGEFRDLTVIPERFREALAVHRLARSRQSLGLPQSVLRMDEIDLASWVIATRDDDAVSAMVAQQLAPLDGAEDLRETLIAYLAHDQQLKATAEALYVHVNTIRYRLNKAETLLGASLSQTATIANLYLALQDEVLGVRAALPVG